MTEATLKLALLVAIGSILAATPAMAGPAKADAGHVKSKCTVINMVLGTGWDVIGGSSQCSMLGGNKPQASSASKQQNTASIRAKDKGR